jgi:hypothetical protein
MSYVNWVWDVTASRLTRVRAARVEARILPGTRDFSRLQKVQSGPGVHTLRYSVGTGHSFSWTKRPVCEADHSPPSTAEVVHEWSYTHPSLFMVT